MTDATVVIPDDGSPEGHAAKMLAMSAPKEGEEGYVAPTGGTEVTPRPDNVPEKFWNAEKGEVNTEALLKSQADAEAALRGAPKVELKEGDEGYVAPVEKPAEQPQVVKDASAEYAEKGELSADTYGKLESAGLSKDMVDQYISGQKLTVSTLQTAAYEPFEGLEGYNKAAEWAAANMEDAEISALDVQLMSNNPAIVAQGAKSLAAAYAKDADVEPDTIRGNSNNPATGGVYTSSREMMKDMNSRKYKTDAAFRNEVAAKLGRSNI